VDEAGRLLVVGSHGIRMVEDAHKHWTRLAGLFVLMGKVRGRDRRSGKRAMRLLVGPRRGRTSWLADRMGFGQCDPGGITYY